jgi:hypothetical protein
MWTNPQYGKTLLTLQRLLFWLKYPVNWSEKLFWWLLCQVRIWITSGQKLCHTALIFKNLVITLEGTFLSKYPWKWSVTLFWWFQGQVLIWLTLGQNQGHTAQLWTNHVNTWGDTVSCNIFWKHSWGYCFYPNILKIDQKGCYNDF